ncbi:MAG: hypothetical protein HY965_03230 [Ignavibacteriales bacterium]|nr:hypothetical protein [Ignavibacteriales bacterium]
MSFKRIFWGVGFVSLGALYLISMISGSTFLPEILYKLWPLLLILIGAAYLVKDEKARYAFAGFGGLVLAIVLFSFLHKPWHCFSFNSHKDADRELRVSAYSKTFDPKFKRVNIELKAGAGAFIIASDSTNQLSLYQKRDGMKFTVDTLFSDSSADFTIETKDVEFKFGDNENHDNSLFLKLHPAPAYTFDFDIGAASADFDFSKLRTEDIKINIGAASLMVKLGAPAERTAEVEIDAGASSMNMLLPKDIGIELETDLALSSKTMSDLKQESENIYRSEGFQSAAKKLYIRVHGGVSSLSISHY